MLNSNVKEITCLALQSFRRDGEFFNDHLYETLELKSPTENIFRSPFMEPFLVIISQTSSFLSLLQTSLQGQYKYAHWCQYLETSNKKSKSSPFPNLQLKCVSNKIFA